MADTEAEAEAGAAASGCAGSVMRCVLRSVAASAASRPAASALDRVRCLAVFSLGFDLLRTDHRAPTVDTAARPKPTLPAVGEPATNPRSFASRGWWQGKETKGSYRNCEAAHPPRSQDHWPAESCPRPSVQKVVKSTVSARGSRSSQLLKSQEKGMMRHQTVSMSCTVLTLYPVFESRR